MRDTLPSLTAVAVALLRALASRPHAPYDGVNDPLAATLLPAPLAPLARATDLAPRLTTPLARALSGGLLDHVALRTAAIDAEVRRAFDDGGGVAQLVILGAGLDARGWRMRELAGAHVYEVDHPATQRLKRARLGARLAAAREVRFVAVDFARDELGARLAAAGHDPDAPTVWIWEGVTPYLPRAALRATLEVVRARSAAGSVLLVTYMTPEMLRAPRLLLGPIRAAFTALGEPLVGAVAPEPFAALLDDAGFALERDTGASEWARAHLAPGRRLLLEVTERLAVARARASAVPRRQSAA